MALLKSKPSDFGAPASYWRVTMRNVDYRQGAAQIQIQGFYDKANADKPNAKPMANVAHVVRGDAFASLVEAGTDRAHDYALLKTLPDWAGAVDA